MRQACRTASDILDRVSDLIRPGITTKEVDQSAADFMGADAGVKVLFWVIGSGVASFPGTFASPLTTKWSTAFGSQRRIQMGDVVKLDIGIIEDGWVGDNATTVPVGIID